MACGQERTQQMPTGEGVAVYQDGMATAQGRIRGGPSVGGQR